MTAEETLKQRGNVHGDFMQNSELIDELMTVLMKRAAWRVSLTPFQRVALTYIMGKVSRIICGDPNYVDHWHDIQGYAKCVEDMLPVIVTELTSQEKCERVMKIAVSGISELASFGGGNSDGNLKAKDLLQKLYDETN